MTTGGGGRKPYWVREPQPHPSSSAAELSLLEEFYGGGLGARNAAHNLIELGRKLQTMALMVNAGMAAMLGTRPLTVLQPYSVMCGPIPAPGAPAPPASEALVPPRHPPTGHGPGQVRELARGMHHAGWWGGEHL